MIPNQNWYAPSLTSNREAGLGNWSIKDIADLLQVGVSHRGTVYGPMAEVVYNSLQYLTDEDVEAMAVYLKALPQRDAEPPPTSQARPGAAGRDGDSGARSTTKQCAMCHGDEGKGMPPDYPPLAGNQSITMASPVNSIRMVLNGGYPPGTRKNPRPHGMPPFAHILNDDEVAAVVTYIRVAWGNSGTPVTPRAGQRAAQAACRNEERHDQFELRRQPTADAPTDDARRRDRRPRAGGRVRGRRRRDRHRGGDLLRVLLLRLPAAGSACSERRGTPITRIGRGGRRAAERRWAIIVDRSSSRCWS